MFPIDHMILFESEQPEPAAPAETLVSVAVSLYNYAGYVEECLRSVAGQTHMRLELIVVDDGSCDASADVAASWLERHGARFARALLVRHMENQGLSQARNTAFECARADYVLVLDADNALYPRAVARLLETLEDSDAGAAFSQMVLFGETVQPGYADTWVPERLKPANYVDAMALVRKSAWARLSGYAHLDLGWEDYDFWCRFAEEGIAAIYVPEMLCRYRVHPASMLRTNTDPHHMRILQQMMARHPWLKLTSR